MSSPDHSGTGNIDLQGACLLPDPKQALLPGACWCFHVEVSVVSLGQRAGWWLCCSLAGCAGVPSVVPAGDASLEQRR